MKDSTKLILLGIGAGVGANMLLAGPVSSATSTQPMAAAGVEGLALLAAGWHAWKHKSKPAAAVAGIAGGLLVAAVQSGALTAKPTPPPAAASTPAKNSGSALPKASTPSGQVAPGSALPQKQGVAVGELSPGFGGAPVSSTDEVLAKELAAANDPGGLFGSGIGPDWDPFSDQSGAAARLGMGPKRTRRIGR